MTANFKSEDKDLYEKNFRTFLLKLVNVAKFKPQEKYIYPIMNGVPFKDLDVALDIAVLQHAKQKANDNG